jgi:hypothetical protein
VEAYGIARLAADDGIMMRRKDAPGMLDKYDRNIDTQSGCFILLIS